MDRRRFLELTIGTGASASALRVFGSAALLAGASGASAAPHYGKLCGRGDAKNRWRGHREYLKHLCFHRAAWSLDVQQRERSSSYTDEMHGAGLCSLWNPGK